MTSDTQKSPRNMRATTGTASAYLDALRGVAALGVLASHWRDCLFVDYADVAVRSRALSLAYLFTGVGHQWVIVFFVLSGYLVGGSVLRQVSAGQWSWSGYALKRFTRLYTVLIPALVLGGLIDLAGLHFLASDGIYGGHSGTHEIVGNIGSRLSLAIASGNCAFLQDIYVPVLGSNGPLWSLSYECWYYVAFPLLACALWYRRRATWRIASATAFAAVFFLVGRDVALLGLIWLMGVAIHWLPARKAASALGRRLWMVSSTAAVGGMIAACKLVHYHPGGLRHFVPMDLALGVTVTFLVYVLATSPEGGLPRAYTWGARHLANSSYSLYLVHVPALVFLTAWLKSPRWQPDAMHGLMAAAILACVFVYAQAIYYCFERNTETIRRGILRPANSSKSHKTNVQGAAFSPARDPLVSR